MQFGIAGLVVTPFAASPILDALRSLQSTRSDTSRRVTRRLEEMLESAELADAALVDIVPSALRDEVLDIERAIVAVRDRGRDLRLLECSYDAREDVLAISVIDPDRSARVGPDDAICAGFAATSTRGAPMRIVPRAWRQVCANGLVVLDRLEQDILSETGDIRAAVLRTLSPATVTRIGQRLDHAARVRVPDPALVLIEARIESDPRPIVREFRRARDSSGWGLINAVTSQARRVRPFGARLDREADTTRLLPILERWSLAEGLESIRPRADEASPD